MCYFSSYWGMNAYRDLLPYRYHKPVGVWKVVVYHQSPAYRDVELLLCFLVWGQWEVDKLCLCLTQGRMDGSDHGDTTVVQHLNLSVEQLLEALHVKDSMVL